LGEIEEWSSARNAIRAGRTTSRETFTLEDASWANQVWKGCSSLGKIQAFLLSKELTYPGRTRASLQR